MTLIAAWMDATVSIQSLWYRPFRVALRKPLVVQGVTSHHRDGFFLCAKDATGNVGCGEISPLPGLSQEDIHDARAQLDRLCEDPTSRPARADLLPSVGFGLAMAQMNLWACQRGRPWPDLASAKAETATTSQVPLQGLLWGPHEQILEQVERQQEIGYRRFKWKVARHPIQEEIELYNAITQRLRPGVRLRLDANRGWSRPDAMAFLNGIDRIHLEFIEEPLKTPAELASFVNDTRCPVALDESLSEALPDDVWESATALVLKPQILGIDNTMGWVKRASERQTPCPCVVSSAFETGLGLAFLAQLSARIAPGAAAGLDTQGWLLGGSGVKGPHPRQPLAATPERSVARPVGRERGTRAIASLGENKQPQVAFPSPIRWAVRRTVRGAECTRRGEGNPQHKDPYGVLAHGGAIDIQTAHEMSLAMAARLHAGGDQP